MSEKGKEVATKPKDAIYSLLVANTRAIKSVLPQHINPERMLRIAYSAFNTTPALRNCSQASIIKSIVEASQLGIEMNGPLGHGWLIPFGSTAQLIIGYKGFMDLAYRSGRVENFSFHPVYKKDVFEYSYGLDPKLVHVPADDVDPGQLTHAYAVVRFKDGASDFEVVNRRIALNAKSRSAAKNKKDSPWNTQDEWTMWCKTAVRQLSKRIPLSPELQKAVALDEQAEAGVRQDFGDIIDVEVESNITESPEFVPSTERPQGRKPATDEPKAKTVKCPDGKGNISPDFCEEEKCLNLDACGSYQGYLSRKNK